MRNLTETNVTDAVLAKLENTADPRLKEIMTSLIAHLHAFVREVELTEEEWFAGIQFLTETGHMCDDLRQEFILLSDTMGVSILVDAMNNRKPEAATPSSVLGPFYREAAPDYANGDSIAGDTAGEPSTVSGRVLSTDGAPIAGALLDVWQTAPNGLYETQDPDQPEFNLRGRFRTDGDGRYAFRTVRPASYPIPDDGPVGKMIRAVGRHPYRPAHIHVIASADGYQPVTTMLFSEGDEYLDSDAVFGVKNALVVDYVEDGAGGYTVDYDFVLAPAPVDT